MSKGDSAALADVGSANRVKPQRTLLSNLITQRESQTYTDQSQTRTEFSVGTSLMLNRETALNVSDRQRFRS
jgi:hypothetical protein